MGSIGISWWGWRAQTVPSDEYSAKRSHRPVIAEAAMTFADQIADKLPMTGQDETGH